MDEGQAKKHSIKTLPLMSTSQRVPKTIRLQKFDAGKHKEGLNNNE